MAGIENYKALWQVWFLAPLRLYDSYLLYGCVARTIFSRLRSSNSEVLVPIFSGKRDGASSKKWKKRLITPWSVIKINFLIALKKQFIANKHARVIVLIKGFVPEE